MLGKRHNSGTSGHLQQGGARYNVSRRADHKQAWQLLQGEVSSAFDKDQTAYLTERLAALKDADERRESGTTWKIINQIAGEDNKADPAKVQKLDG